MHNEDLINLSSDYDDFYVVSKSDAVAQYEKAERILSVVEKYLSEQY